MKDYLGYENERNKHNAALYTELMKRAIGQDCAVLIGHHLTFEIGGDLETENEIPSADTLLFDHELMGKVFGDRAGTIMLHLASVPVPERDQLLARYLKAYPADVGEEEVDPRVFGTTNAVEAERLATAQAEGRM